MSDKSKLLPSDQSEQGRAPDRGNPGRLIFLVLPLISVVVALTIAGGRPTNDPNALPTPRPVAYTVFTLVGSRAPDFTLATPDGKTIQLSSLRGRWVFLNFWATWCPPCLDEMPDLQRLQNGELGTVPEGLTVLAVNKEETADQIKTFMADLRLSLPVVMDSENQVHIRYGIVSLPNTYLIDPAGVVRARVIGALKADLIRRYLKRINEGGDLG